jgi:hypothetical protein
MMHSKNIQVHHSDNELNGRFKQPLFLCAHTIIKQRESERERERERERRFILRKHICQNVQSNSNAPNDLYLKTYYDLVATYFAPNLTTSQNVS